MSFVSVIAIAIHTSLLLRADILMFVCVGGGVFTCVCACAYVRACVRACMHV